MPTTVTREQERWTEITSDPQLRDLPYKVETNARGQIILSPHPNAHSRWEARLQKLLTDRAPRGETYPAFAIATPKGIKVPDVVWTTPERERAMNETGDPTIRAGGGFSEPAAGTMSPSVNHRPGYRPFARPLGGWYRR